MYDNVPVNTQTKVKRNRRLFIATYFPGNSTKYTTNKPANYINDRTYESRVSTITTRCTASSA